jgi:hypothetical protein
MGSFFIDLDIVARAYSERYRGDEHRTFIYYASEEEWNAGA